MGIVLGIVIGAIFGWLSSIVLRSQTQNEILFNIVVGIVGALLANISVLGPSAMLGISLPGVIMAVFGSVVLLALVNLARRVLRR